jgi:hypothetical protein
VIEGRRGRGAPRRCTPGRWHSGPRGRLAYRHDLLPRFYPDATGPVFLDDLPPAEDLAFAALVNARDPLLEDLVRLDAVDAPDLAPVPDASE